jgi:multimeric flavodoxin WrbA
MKVLAISGSPRPKSLTDRFLNLVIEGLGTKAEVTKYYPHKMKIAFCTGCRVCWFKTPGQCAINDDMTEFIPRFEEADLVLLASPIYLDGFTAQTWTLLNRTTSRMECFLKPGEPGRSRHLNLREKQQRAVLISTCGFPEPANFEALKGHFAAICANLLWENSGSILVPESAARSIPDLFDTKFAAARQAGVELQTGNIKPETAVLLAQPIMSPEKYRDMVNNTFTSLLERQQKEKSGRNEEFLGNSKQKTHDKSV